MGTVPSYGTIVNFSKTTMWYECCMIDLTIGFGDTDVSLRTTSGREKLRRKLAQLLDLPFMLAALILLGLTIAELVLPLPIAWQKAITTLGIAIWLLFLLDFAIELALAENKWRFLRGNWIIAISVLIPFFRILVIARAARLVRPLWLVRFTAQANRAISEIRQAVRGRQFILVTAVITVIALSGSAAIFFFERDDPTSPYHDFLESFWYTATIITTIGGERNPVTTEGRMVSFMLMVTGMSLFGYIAAAVASYFVRKDVEKELAEKSEESGTDEILAEIRLLRARLEEIEAQREVSTETNRKKRGLLGRLLRRE